jgi:hypothetical protein
VSPPPAAPSPPVAAPLPERPWEVADLTPGNWVYRKEGSDSLALFGDEDTEALLVLRCEVAGRRITLSLVLGFETPARALSIRTSNGVLNWSAAFDDDGIEMLVAGRPANDPGWDAIAFSRGRIAIEAEGLPRLIVPVWAELSRTVEDCRG